MESRKPPQYADVVEDRHFQHKGVRVHELVVNNWFNTGTCMVIWAREEFTLTEVELPDGSVVPNPVAYKEMLLPMGEHSLEFAKNRVMNAFDDHWNL